MNRERTFRGAIDAILANSARLLDDAEMLEFADPPATAVFLAQIAQEELAKAFLLCLVMRGLVPWHRNVLRATRDHTCKQLLGIVMDHVQPPDEQFHLRIQRFIQTREVSEFPKKVADAIAILRHEKIGRWVSASWVRAEDPEYHREALAVADGRLDRRKQDALYVRLGIKGAVASTPQTLGSLPLADEMDRARRFCTLVKNVRDGHKTPGFDWSEVEELFRALFTAAHQG